MRLRRLRSTLRDRKGATAAVFAASAVTVFGLVALSVEGGHWYFAKRNQTSAVDMGALAGANARYWSGLSNPSATAENEGRTVARQTVEANGFVHGATSYGGATEVEINIPPKSGPNAGNSYAVEAIVRQRLPTFIAGLFTGHSEVLVRSRAVAASMIIGPACVLSLHGTLTFTGSSTAATPGCVMGSNANIRVQGMGTTVNTAGLYAHGTCDGCTQSNVTASYVGSGQPPLPDPLSRSVQGAPYPTSCPGGSTGQSAKSINDAIQNHFKNSTQPFQFGSTTGQTYICGSGGGPNSTLQLTASQVVDLRPGTYYFVGTDLTINSSNAALICSQCVPGGAGVTLVFTSDGNRNPGVLTLNGGTMQLNAPGSGAYEDLLIYRGPDVNPCSGSNANCPPRTLINGSNSTNLIGNIYAPTGQITMSGNSNNALMCTILVAHTITFTGNTDMARDCERIGIEPQKVRVVRLLEAS